MEASKYATRGCFIAWVLVFLGPASLDFIACILRYKFTDPPYPSSREEQGQRKERKDPRVDPSTRLICFSRISHD